MNKLSKILATLLLFSVAFISSCDNDDDEPDTPVNEDQFVISANITENTTWSASNVYTLAGRIAVESGATLTIEPGTVIKGQAGTGPNATALLVARGGKLMAEGTAALPIIFTSVADEITPEDVAAGRVASPNLDPDLNGLWGGLIVLGNAPISDKGNSGEEQIEGIPGDDSNGLYGGTVADDNSGIIKYVSVRHGGANIGEGNEINGITFGGVGSGTVVEYVEVVANQDDGIEWFGGTVNVTNAVVWNAGDDAIDTDQNWSGTLSNFAVVCGADTDHGLELDGPEGDARTANGHTITMGTIKGYIDEDDGVDQGGAELGNLRDSVEVTISDVYFFNFPDPSTGRGDFSLNDDVEPNLTLGTVTLTGLQMTLRAGELGDVFKDGSAQAASAVGAGANTVGADKSKFAGWSWAAASGGLNDF